MRISEEEAASWKKIEAKLAEAERAVNEAHLLFVKEIGVLDSNAYRFIDRVERLLRTRETNFIPQWEWLGGGKEIYAEAIRPPRIAGDLYPLVRRPAQGDTDAHRT